MLCTQQVSAHGVPRNSVLSLLNVVPTVNVLLLFMATVVALNTGPH